MSLKMYMDLIEARRGRPRKNPLPDNNKGSQGETEDSADKNIIMQMRKVVSLRGQKPVEFDDGNKVELPVHHAQKAIEKFQSLRTPIDKQNFTNTISKSYSHFKKHVLGEDVVLEEEQSIDESMDVHVTRTDKKQGNKPLYKVHKVGSSVSGVKVGEHITDTEMDDLQDMGHNVKEVKPRKPRTMKEQLEDIIEAMHKSNKETKRVWANQKQRYGNMSDAEFKQKHGKKSVGVLRMMARQHGYDDHNHYVKRAGKNVSEMYEQLVESYNSPESFKYFAVSYQYKNTLNRIVEATTNVYAMNEEHALYIAKQRLGSSAKLV